MTQVVGMVVVFTFLYLVAKDVVRASENKADRGRLAHAALHLLVVVFAFAAFGVTEGAIRSASLVRYVFIFGGLLIVVGAAVALQKGDSPAERLSGIIAIVWGITTLLGFGLLYLYAGAGGG
ncbi:hypothetical protein HY633_00845 [Candidatus Uhrbacteria bacterium]|nr:hypothetical protein [Candidatus Uhrbacteria bacterium]